jgi:hypothetical protein
MDAAVAPQTRPDRDMRVVALVIVVVLVLLLLGALVKYVFIDNPNAKRLSITQETASKPDPLKTIMDNLKPQDSRFAGCWQTSDSRVVFTGDGNAYGTDRGQNTISARRYSYNQTHIYFFDGNGGESVVPYEITSQGVLNLEGIVLVPCPGYSSPNPLRHSAAAVKCYDPTVQNGSTCCFDVNITNCIPCTQRTVPATDTNTTQRPAPASQHEAAPPPIMPPQPDTANPSTCVDAKHNGDETDVDCGGSCPVPCGKDRGCNTDRDCVTPYVCTNGVCTEGSAALEVDGFRCDGSTRTLTFRFKNTDTQRNWQLDNNVPFPAPMDLTGIQVLVNSYQANGRTQPKDLDGNLLFGPKWPFSENCGGVEVLKLGADVTCTLSPVPIKSANQLTYSFNEIFIKSPTSTNIIRFTCG